MEQVSSGQFEGVWVYFEPKAGQEGDRMNWVHVEKLGVSFRELKGSLIKRVWGDLHSGRQFHTNRNGVHTGEALPLTKGVSWEDKVLGANS